MEKAFKLDFENDKAGSLDVNCCGCSRTEGLHSFGPASKPHYLIHYVLSGRGCSGSTTRSTGWRRGTAS